MTYQLLKMLHVAAVVAWLGGSLFVSLFLLSSQPQDSDEAPKERKMLGALRRWTLCVTTPAMVLTWLVGLHLAMTFGWFAMTWIWVKVAFALALSALLGIQSAALRRMANGSAKRPPLVDLYAPFTVIASAVIVTLVVVKPF
ncbi:CopD family protein [Achromobacter insolitus]|uniref:CopD family protein n=1 Tax=Achromobacter insolitus TaxID=217204 RepID=UPI001E4DCB6F|nr:CopD family protein [Achromobacter insolitus]